MWSNREEEKMSRAAAFITDWSRDRRRDGMRATGRQRTKYVDNICNEFKHALSTLALPKCTHDRALWRSTVVDVHGRGSV